MTIDSFLRDIFKNKISLKKESPQWTLPIAHGKIVPIEVIQQKPKIGGNPEFENAGTGDTKPALRLTKEPNNAFVNERRFVDWVDLEGDVCARRIPRPCIRRYSLRNGFRVGKVEYRSLSELRAEILDQEKHLYKDVHGRTFAEIKERFPCFDSFDYANEDRYYHWLYLTENGKLFLVYYEDEDERVTVTEDVKEIGANVWREMVRLGWTKDVEIQTITDFLGAIG